MPVTITTELRLQLLRSLALGMSADDVADELDLQASDIIALARNHGYPDREQLTRAADIVENNLRNGPTAPTPRAPVHATTRPAPPLEQAANVGDLLRAGRQHPNKKIAASAEHIIERVTRLRALIAEDEAKRAERRRKDEERKTAQAEVERLRRQLAEAKAKLHHNKGDHACRVEETCTRSFASTQARGLHERRAHPDAAGATTDVA